MITAVVLGNGSSRKGFDYRKEYPNATVYGCNGAYIEDIDVVVCNDVLRQKNIFDSGFCEKGVCVFGEWEGQNRLKSRVRADAKYDGKYIIESGKEVPKEHFAVVLEKDDLIYMFHVDDEKHGRNIIYGNPHIEEHESTGRMALNQAMQDGHMEIVLIGFDDIDDPNWSSLYEGHSGYENHFPKRNWLPDIQAVIDSQNQLAVGPNITMRKVK